MHDKKLILMCLNCLAETLHYVEIISKILYADVAQWCQYDIFELCV